MREEGKYASPSGDVQKPNLKSRVPIWHRVVGGFLLPIFPLLSTVEVVKYYGKRDDIYQIAGALLAEVFYAGFWVSFYCWFKPQARSRFVVNLTQGFLLVPFLAVIIGLVLLFFSERGQFYNFFELLFSLLTHGLLLGIGISMVLGKA